MRRCMGSLSLCLFLLGLGMLSAAAWTAEGPAGPDEIFPSREAAVLASGFDLDQTLVMTPVGQYEGVVLYQLAYTERPEATYLFVEEGPDAKPVPVAFVAGRETLFPREDALRDASPLSPAVEGGSEPLRSLSAGAAGFCAPDGGFDDTLSQTSCCSGVAVSGTTSCFNPSDFGTTWKSCIHLCGSRLVNGCVPSGGVDDTLGNTNCCGAAVTGSTRCLNPADFGTTWRTCIHTCA